MPFDATFDDTYKLGIKAACEAAGAVAERVDEQIFQESILQRVFTQISKADVIVAEMTGRNPNVFYETGYAHALGKTVILLTREAEDIPFDLKHYPHIVYHGRIVDLRSALEQRVRYLLDNPPRSVADSVNSVEVQVNGVKIADRPTIEITYSANMLSIGLRVSIHNSAAIALRTISCRLALVTARMFSRTIGSGQLRPQTERISDTENLHYFLEPIELLPGTWHAQTITPIVDGAPGIVEGDEYHFSVRIFTAAGPFDYPFRIRLVSGIVV